MRMRRMMKGMSRYVQGRYIVQSCVGWGSESNEMSCEGDGDEGEMRATIARCRYRDGRPMMSQTWETVLEQRDVYARPRATCPKEQKRRETREAERPGRGTGNHSEKQIARR
ncbi:hypothetical protein BD309DRAFT_751621 [Dichomitus squalens]|nr:hypothetical protein BD309DRAFT_751621 [Dichomitus squalens]